MQDREVINQIQSQLNNLVGMFNQLRIDFEKFTVKSESEHDHLSEKLDEHIKEGSEKYDKMNDMLDVLYNSLMQLQGNVDAADKIYRERNKSKEKRKAVQMQWRIAMLMTLGTVIGGILGVMFSKWF